MQADESQFQYHCKICFKRFEHSSALGGHISKAHPGQSSAYNHKKRVREMRELERELHRHTMKIYQEEFAPESFGPSLKDGSQPAPSTEDAAAQALQSSGDKKGHQQ